MAVLGDRPRPSGVDNSSGTVSSRKKTGLGRRFTAAGAIVLGLSGLIGTDLALASCASGRPIHMGVNLNPHDGIVDAERAMLAISRPGHPEQKSQGVFVRTKPDAPPSVLTVVPREIEHDEFVVFGPAGDQLTVSATPVDLSANTDVNTLVQLQLPPGDAEREAEYVTPLKLGDLDAFEPDQTVYTVLRTPETYGAVGGKVLGTLTDSRAVVATPASQGIKLTRAEYGAAVINGRDEVLGITEGAGEAVTKYDVNDVFNTDLPVSIDETNLQMPNTGSPYRSYNDYTVTLVKPINPNIK